MPEEPKHCCWKGCPTKACALGLQDNETGTEVIVMVTGWATDVFGRGVVESEAVMLKLTVPCAERLRFPLTLKP